MDFKVIKRDFFKRDTLIVAEALLGQYLVSTINGHTLVGVISETEAYRSDDPASHTYRGETLRNSSMFGPVGHAYVYISYGIHYCMNVVARDLNNFPAGGALIRAIIPICGIEQMEINRGHINFRDLANGPGKVTQALGITIKDDGIDLLNKSNKIFLAYGCELDQSCIEATPRIGISVAQERHWRFLISRDCAKEIAGKFSRNPKLSNNL